MLEDAEKKARQMVEEETKEKLPFRFRESVFLFDQKYAFVYHGRCIGHHALDADRPELRLLFSDLLQKAFKALQRPAGCDGDQSASREGGAELLKDILDLIGLAGHDKDVCGIYKIFKRVHGIKAYPGSICIKLL